MQLIDVNNIGQSRLITITFKENTDNLEFTHKEFNLWIKRVSYHLKKKLEYVSVIEYQERGAIHYHVVFFNLKEKLDLKLMRSLWEFGSVNVKRITDTNGIGHYLTYYFDIKDERLIERKMYLCSQGLKRPILRKENSHLNDMGISSDYKLEYSLDITNDDSLLSKYSIYYKK